MDDEPAMSSAVERAVVRILLFLILAFSGLGTLGALMSKDEARNPAQMGYPICFTVALVGLAVTNRGPAGGK